MNVDTPAAADHDHRRIVHIHVHRARYAFAVVVATGGAGVINTVISLVAQALVPHIVVTGSAPPSEHSDG